MDSTLPHHHGKQSFWQQAKAVAIDWVKITWFDLLVMVVLTAAALGIYQAPLAATRTFPITFDRSGDIVYPEFAYPSRGWIIEPWLSALLSFGIPLIVILAMQFRIRSFSDLNNAVIGLCYSLILSTLFQVILKNLIGGFRPWFLEACQPDISLAKNHNTTGLNGVGYKQIMYTIEICTQPNPKIIKTAATSFPSGHSTAAFAGFGYLFLYLNAKLKVWSDHRASLWKLAIIFAPIEGAVLSVCALTVDQAHNWYDCLAGSIIGIVFAFACYRLMYAAIWDWRFNHIPLHPKEACLYTTGSEIDKSRPLFTHQSGWGQVAPTRPLPSPSPSGKDG